MLAGLHVILLRVADVERVRDFYQTLFNLELLEEPRSVGRLAHLRIPGIAYPDSSPYSGTFEIIAGGTPQVPPADRIASPTTPVLQVDDVPATLARAIELGGTKVNDPWQSEQRVSDDPRTIGVQLAYFADPEGHVMGVRCPIRVG